jgi:hypothetical protein
VKGLTGIVLGMAAIGTLSSVFMNVVALSVQRPVEFFWVTADGDGNPTIECEAQVLEQPAIRPSAITSFARDAVLNVNEFTYLSWDAVLPEALEAYFTPSAARIYMRGFENSSLLKTVKENYYESGSISTFPSVIISESSQDGRREWVVQVPTTTYYQTGGSRSDSRYRARVRVVHRLYTVRVVEQEPSPENFRGVAVVDMASRDISNPAEFYRSDALGEIGGRS